MKFKRFFSAVRDTFCRLAALSCGVLPASSAEIFSDAKGKAELTEMAVNDGMTGSGMFRFEFSSGWNYDTGYPSRFYGGDEHWTTAAVSGGVLPYATLRFFGVKVSLYGHKVPAGGIARLTIDGTDAGMIDFYNGERVEKALLFESPFLDNGPHTLNIQMVDDHNPSAGDSHEAAIDYAVVLTDKEIPVDRVELSLRTLTLEPGMRCGLSWTLLPEYATETPEVNLTSSDGSILKVSTDGELLALKPGSASVTVSVGHGRCADSVSVTVREPVGGDLSGMAGTTDRHTCQRDYFSFLERWNPEDTSVSAVVWQDDTAAVKLDLMTKSRCATGVRASVDRLTDARGNILEADTAVYFVKNTNAHDTGHDIPDVLCAQESVDIPAQSLSSVWVRIKTAVDALPGVYTGNVHITADGGITLIFPLKVEVIGLAAPANTAELELWQYPYSSNRYYSGKTTEEYFGSGVEGMWKTHLDPGYEAGLISQIRLYAAAGGKSVTTTIVEDPWNSQTPDPYPSMIKWTRKVDGEFSFDYSDFGYWVALNGDNGVDGRILAFSISDWANRVTYFDETAERVVTEDLTPGSSRWKEVWGVFLRSFMDYTTETGVFDRVYMAMDERPAEVAESVLNLVESVRNDKGECFRTALAVYTFETEYLFDRVTDLSLALNMDAEKVKKIAEHRHSLGLTTTLYTCGAQFSALESRPIEGLYTLWYCRKCGTDGFLRWALDAFNADPLRSSSHRLFAAGDIYLIYPDETDGTMTARSSPRFEKLAEGCRDVSKFDYLWNAVPERRADILQPLTAMEGKDMEAEIHRAKDALNRTARYAALSGYIAAAEQTNSRDAELSSTLEEARRILHDSCAAEDVLADAAERLAALLNKRNKRSENPKGMQNDR